MDNQLTPNAEIAQRRSHTSCFVIPGACPQDATWDHEQQAAGTLSEEELMIELLTGFPDNVAAFAYHGQVTRADYEKVLIPDFDDRLRRREIAYLR
ncbi:hypothetical protein MAUB_00030 [Mycolicibacterium aubagnense]|uniref:Uncharacterized protein n=1 Tax=Mycolicibacterium aubagnense TaxID=319707 RepID=A0ABN5YKD5_9MYCO|nr:hypothetical protein MAUB_00030 [Mycolicibacterium aubagnense]